MASSEDRGETAGERAVFAGFAILCNKRLETVSMPSLVLNNKNADGDNFLNPHIEVKISFMASNKRDMTPLNLSSLYKTLLQKRSLLSSHSAYTIIDNFAD